jgi:class 3 adenylate cyclase
MPKPKRPKKPKPPSLKQQFEHMRLALIDTWLALPPERRTNFLRRRIGIASTAL